MEAPLTRRASERVIQVDVALQRLAWPVGLFALALLLRAAWMSYVDLSPVNDARFYFLAAQSLAAGEGFADPFNDILTKSMAPGYSLTLASLFAVFGSKLIVGQAFNLFAAAAAAPIVYFIGVRVRDQRTGIVAGSIMALFPSQVFFTSMLMTEPLFTTLAALLILAVIAWMVDKGAARIWQVFVAGLLLGYMSLVRAEAVALLPALVLLWLAVRWSWQRIALGFTALLIGAAVVITPWTVRNYVQFDEPVLIRGEEGEFSRVLRLGLSPDYDALKYRYLGGTHAAPASWSELLDYYAENPSEIAILGANKVRDFFGSEAPFFFIDPRQISFFSPEFALSAGEARTWGGVADGFYYAVIALALLGAPLWLSLKNRQLLVVLWFVASWSLIHLSFVPQERYHYPLLPALSVLAALTVVAIWRRVTDSGSSRSALESTV